MTLVNSADYVLDNPYNLYNHIASQGRVGLPIAIPSSSIIARHFINSAGEADMAVDAGSTWYQFQNSDDHISIINRVTWVMRDNGIAPNKFGGMTALPGGVDIDLVDSGNIVLVHLHDAVNIKTHDAFGFLCGDHFFFDSGAGVDALTFVWDLYGNGNPILLLPGEIIRMTVQDCLGGLDAFAAMIQGTIHHVGRF